MERVVVVFFNGVLFKSPFLIWVVFLSFNRQNINFVALLIFQHIYSISTLFVSLFLALALLSSHAPPPPDTARPNIKQMPFPQGCH